MSRRILSVVVTVLGLVLVALAVCSATIWKPSSKVEAKLASGPSQPYVFTAPGVLSGVGSDVTVTATTDLGEVTLPDAPRRESASARQTCVVGEGTHAFTIAVRLGSASVAVGS